MIDTLATLKKVVHNNNNGNGVAEIQVIEFDVKKRKIQALNFFQMKDKYVREKFSHVEITLSPTGILATLKTLGFQRYDYSNQKSVMVQLHDNIVEEVSTQRIIDAFMDFIEDEIEEVLESPDGHEVDRELLKDKVLRSLNAYFSDTFLYRLKTSEKFEFNEDTSKESFFYYQNGFVRVDKEKVELLDYKHLTKKVWRGQILARDFKPCNRDAVERSKWSLFVNFIAGNTFTDGKEKDPERTKQLRRVLGYLLHRYYEGKLKCIIFTDSREGDEDGGRSGKSLVMKGVSWMMNASQESRNFCEIDGKEFDPLYAHKWQQVEVSTQIVNMNDVRKNFPLEFIYNAILEGITVQKKNDKPFVVKAKIALSTNKTIRTQGPSAQDRVFEFQMSDYFSEKWSPQQEFKEWFKTDWNAERWFEFDCFMLESVRMYLSKGLPNATNFNLERRKFKDETSNDFVEFVADIFTDGYSVKKKELVSDFKRRYTDWDKLTSNRFTMWLKAFKTYHPDWEIEERRIKEESDYELTFLLKKPSNTEGVAKP